MCVYVCAYKGETVRRLMTKPVSDYSQNLPQSSHVPEAALRVNHVKWFCVSVKSLLSDIFTVFYFHTGKYNKMAI